MYKFDTMSNHWILLGLLLISVILNSATATNSSVQDGNEDSDYPAPVVADSTTTTPPGYPEISDPDILPKNRSEPSPTIHDERAVLEPEKLEESSQHESSTITNITIFIVGRSGSGVSSTIRELIGPDTTCVKPDGNETFQNFMEYTLTLSNTDQPEYNIKLVDVPGFVDGRTLEQDAKILASMKSYSQQYGFPNYYLALSRFDDNRMDGVHSLFVQLLKRVELFQKIYFKNATSDNTVFLLTRLMSETRTTQRRPVNKINIFKNIIEQYTSFAPPITAIVGDNNAGKEHSAPVEGGYYKLPNKQHYPKNIWEALINVSSSSSADEERKREILTTMMNRRESKDIKCEARLVPTDWVYYDDDAYDYLYLIQQKNITVEQNEVNNKIQDEFDKTLYSEKLKRIVQTLALQLRLQNMNITSNKTLPTTLSGQAALFQSNRFSSGISAILLTAAFNMRMPEYIKSINVGFGYDLLKDEIVPQTPFRTDILRSTQIGYALPTFLNCRKFFEPDVNYYKTYSQTMPDYTTERFKYLEFPGKENMTEYKFDLRLKEGFNLKPDDRDNVVTLFAVKETRTLKCSLDKAHLVLNSDILEASEYISKFNQRSKDSVNEWQNFFNKFGSHIVTQTYGGGSMIASLVGSNLRNILVSQSKVESALDSVVKLTNFSGPELPDPSYRFFGGSPDAQMEKFHELPTETQKILLNAWTETLSSDFDMLNYDLGLEPISEFIKTFSKEKGDFIEEAIELLLRGELIYQRKSRNRTTTVRSTPKPTTRTPYISHDTTNPTTRQPIWQPKPGYAPAPAASGEASESKEAGTMNSFPLNDTDVVGLMGQTLEEQQKLAAKRFEEQMEVMRRQREEQRRRAQEQTARMLEMYRKQTENQGIYTKQLEEQIKNQTENQISATNAQIELIRRKNYDDQKKHVIDMIDMSRKRCQTLRDEYNKCKYSSNPFKSCGSRELEECENCKHDVVAASNDILELPPTVSVVVMGRKGSGITSTVRQLLGTNAVIHQTHVAVASTDILEYTLRIQPPTGETGSYYLKVIDVPGLGAEQTLELDTEILASLKAYLSDKGIPTFFVVVTKFNDNLIYQQYTQLVKRVEIFQRALFHTTTDNAVFLLARFLNDSPEIRQFPSDMVNEFKRVIEHSTTFPSPIEILLGDNKPDEATPVEGGYYRLPNNELYPKNVWQKLLEVSRRSVITKDARTQAVIHHVLETMIGSREAELHTQEVVPHIEDEVEFDEDTKALLYLLAQDNVLLPRNEVQRRLHDEYENQEADVQIQGALQALALQVRLRNDNITEFQQLPQTIPDTLKFLQVDGITSKYSLLLLEKGLHLEAPSYPVNSLVVGYGYDLLRGTPLRQTPFQENVQVISTCLGYYFPKFMDCEKLDDVEEKTLANVAESAEELQTECLEYLKVSLPETGIDATQLRNCEAKPFINLNPSDSGTLVAIREVRVLKCKIRTKNDISLNKHFISAVNALPALNTSDSRSVSEWRLFLHHFGAHIVKKGYGGGSIQVTQSLSGEGTSGTTTKENIEQALNSIANFENATIVSENESKDLIYQFRGGNVNPKANQLNLLDSELQIEILTGWKNSLNIDFDMLTNELELVPLSQLVGVVDTNKEGDAANATSLLLQGRLQAENVENEFENAENERNVELIKASKQALILQNANIEEALDRLQQLNDVLDSETD
ncbi:Septin spn5 [Orchesella cincta]|uniref:Septin spn5 n=1 Tax=Orchesella cincta TaxID=48709 RepID=A0A1D2N8G8_ORCCI|nr:Septin spn5 [Orchesella cincta]